MKEIQTGFKLKAMTMATPTVNNKLRMNNTFISGVLVIAAFYSQLAFSQNIEWVQKAGGQGDDYGTSVLVGKSGSIYITGQFELTAVFGKDTLTKKGLRKNHNIFLAKYKQNGEMEWVKRAGGGGDVGEGIGIDAFENIYITGEFEDTADFDDITIISSGKVNDIFIAKYDSSGKVQFAVRAGGTNSDKGNALTADPSGNVYITGEFRNWAYFGNTTLVSNGSKDVFVAKYNSTDGFLWVKQIGGDGCDVGNAICYDNEGNVYVSGYFSDTLKFNKQLIIGNGEEDAFLAKYNSTGTLLWLKKIGGSGEDKGTAIYYNNENIYLTGQFSDTANFDTSSLISAGMRDVFIAQYDKNGNIEWLKSAGGTADDMSEAIVSDSTNVYITGKFGFAADFDHNRLNCSDSADIFIACYDINGNSVWAKSAGSDSKFELGMGIDVFQKELFCTGSYSNNALFDNQSLISQGQKDLFLEKLTSFPLITSSPAKKTPPITENDSSCFASITPSGSLTFCSGANVVLNANESLGYSYQWEKDGIAIPEAIYPSYSANLSGDYRVKITQGSCITWSVPNKVTVNTSLTAKITSGGPTTFCSGGSVLLYANTCPEYTYQWKRNGVAIPGATTSIYTATLSGDYQVKIVQGSVIVWSTLTSVTVTACMMEDSLSNLSSKSNVLIAGETEIKSYDEPLQVKIYPNPTNGQFALEIIGMNELTNERFIIEVTDALGKLVYLSDPALVNGNIKKAIELDKELPTGIYFLTVTIGNKEESTRLMLAK